MNSLRTVAVMAVGFGAFAAADAAATPTWVAAWYSPPIPPTAVMIYNDVRVFDHQTVRQVVRLEAAGDRVRLRLTNEEGFGVVKFGAIHIAFSSPNGVTDAKTDRVVLFGGKPDGEIKRGEALVSDPIDFKVPAFQQVAVSIYYPGRLAPSGHLALQRLSKPGDHAAEAVMPFVEIARPPSALAGIDVEAPAPRNVMVAFGDSITEGACSTQGWNMSWPQQLSLRLAKARQGKTWTIINAGISGNRLLYDGAGAKAVERFDRDVLSITGLKSIVVLEGINDIGTAFTATSDTGPRSAEDIIGAYKQLITRAHARGLKIFGGTILPYEDAGYYHPEGEAVRRAVNDWIRTSGAFDGVIDFEQAVRDPQHPTRYRGADQSGDNLHPNDAGYHAMSEAVDLKALK